MRTGNSPHSHVTRFDYALARPELIAPNDFWIWPAQRADDGDAGDGDKRDDEGVFDEGSAVFVNEDAFEVAEHRYLS